MDLCNKCIKDVPVATFDREDLDEPFTSTFEDPDYNELGIIVGFDCDTDYENL